MADKFPELKKPRKPAQGPYPPPPLSHETGEEYRKRTNIAPTPPADRATARPWVTEGEEEINDLGNLRIVSSPSEEAHIGFFFRDEDAALIVAAVNERDALLAERDRLKEALLQVEQNADFNTDNTVILPLWVVDRIRAALARTAEEVPHV